MHLVIVRIMISLLKICWRQDREEKNIRDNRQELELYINCHHGVIYFHSNTLYLFQFGAVKVPATNLVISSEHIHGHHADGESHSSHNDFPRMGGHKQAVDSEKSRQHFKGVLRSLTVDDRNQMEEKKRDLLNRITMAEL